MHPEDMAGGRESREERILGNVSKRAKNKINIDLKNPSRKKHNNSIFPKTLEDKTNIFGGGER